MKLPLFLAKNIYISIPATWLPFIYSVINKAIPPLQAISLMVGISVGVLTVYGKYLEIKKFKGK